MEEQKVQQKHKDKDLSSLCALSSAQWVIILENDCAQSEVALSHVLCPKNRAYRLVKKKVKQRSLTEQEDLGFVLLTL